MEGSTQKTITNGAVYGLIVLTLVGLGLGGCGNENSNLCSPSGAYDFALEVSTENTERFLKKSSKNSILYHDESVEFESFFLLGWWPTKGKGVFVEVDEDGDLSVCEWDASEMEKVSAGEIKPSQLTGKSFGYEHDGELGEAINLFDNGSMVSYSKSDNGWQKRCYDTSRLEEGMSFASLPTLSIQKAEDAEVQKFLELVNRIKQNYPIE